MNSYKNILIAVDVQNGFARKSETKMIAAKIEKLLSEKLFDVSIVSKFYNKPGSPYRQIMNWQGLIDEKEQQLFGKIEQYADVIIEKDIYSCLNSEFLEILKEKNNGTFPKRVFLCGIDTDCCVLKNAVDLFENGIVPIVLKEYCRSNGGKGSHNAGITAMKRFIGGNCIYGKDIEKVEDIKTAIVKSSAIIKIRPSIIEKEYARKYLKKKNESVEQINKVLKNLFTSTKNAVSSNNEVVEIVSKIEEKTLKMNKSPNMKKRELASLNYVWEDETLELIKELQIMKKNADNIAF